jgi:hypothetical protein
MEFTAVVKEGEFVVQTCEVSAQGETKAKHGNVSNNLIPKSRHSRLKSESDAGEDKAKDEAKAKHPRAEELARLFDPLLLRSCQRSLSADSVVFSEVLDVLGDVPHDFLVKFVVERAKRPISSPKVCLSIVKDVVQSWREMKGLSDAQRIPPQSSGRKSFAESVRDEAQRRIAKYGRVI